MPAINCTGVIKRHDDVVAAEAIAALALLIGLAGLGATGCRDARTVFRLADELKAEFAGTAVGVSLTDGIILTVTATDSVLALASCETQVSFALEVGRFLHAQYSDLRSLQVVSVGFALPDRGEIPLRNAHLPIRFNPAAVATGLLPEDSVSAVASCRAYEELNQS